VDEADRDSVDDRDMRRMVERGLPVLGLVLMAGAIPAVALHEFGRTMIMVPMTAHCVVVAVAGAAAFAAAVALTVAGVRRGDGRAVIVGAAFSGMASMLVVHALATPSVLIGDNGLVQLAGAANLPAGAAVLTLSAVPALRRPASVIPVVAVQCALLLAIAVIAVVGLVDPPAIPVLPGPGGRPAEGVIALGLLAFGVLAYRAGRTFLLTRRRGDLGVVVGVVWLACALAGLLTFGYMDLGFWIAHGLEVGGLVLVGLPVALDLRRGAQSYPLAGDLSAVRLVAEEEAFLGPRVRSLLVRLAEKDDYTEAHTRAVSLLAVQIGERLGLAPTRLRTLALGALLHDMGKLAVPDAILQKPGPLTDEEFAVIRKHPTWGDELLVELGGFSADVRKLVLNHHERLDGKGYPNRLAADELDLETRILTVCDVYDALVSKRVYRDAWTPERALGLLHEETGTAFDAGCVEALEAVLAGGRQAERRAARTPLLRPATT
jgi:HD-GYP domain-containing protein (c-di-GMP phosphodiesterase class II)